MYEDLYGQVRRTPLVHTDATGWRIDGRSALLMGFDNGPGDALSDPRKASNEEVHAWDTLWLPSCGPFGRHSIRSVVAPSDWGIVFVD